MLAWIKKYQAFVEPLIFYAVLLISLYPIFSTSTFPFADAPAHLGNASLIKQLLHEERGGFLSQFISFNRTIVPNWTGHFSLVSLLHVFSPETSEKILLFIIFTGLPLSVRYLLHVLQKDKKFLALLAIPITYNCQSGLGFYNFSLSLIFLFSTLAFFYQRILDEKPRWYNYFILAALFAAGYFSHVVGFFVTVFFVALAYGIYSARLSGGVLSNWFSKKSLLLLLTILPVIVLAVSYTLAKHADTGQMSFLDTDLLVDYLVNGRAFLVFGKIEEGWCATLTIVYASMLILALYLFVREIRNRNSKTVSVLFISYVLFLIAGYFFLPDGYGQGGYLSLRIQTLLFAFIVPFVALSQIRKLFLWMAVGITMFVHFQRLSLYEQIQSENNRIANGIIEQAAHVENNSFIVVYDLDPNWVQVSYSHYLCLGKPVIAFNNYEYNTQFFPLVWKDSKMNILHDALYKFQALDLCKKALGGHPIYYWVKGDPASPLVFNETLKKNLENNCKLVNSNIFASLYKLR